MAVELAEIAAGLPLAASFAMASGITAFREGRRRISLNEAMHELRRPLQVLALSLPADSPSTGAIESALQMATAAIDQLDREINGGPAAVPAEPVSAGPMVALAVARWRPRAAAEGRSLRLIWGVGELELRGDRLELGQALDNLISNALEHGRGDVTIDVREERGLLRVGVRDRGPSEGSQWRSRLRRPERGTRRRHGHGLRIVRRVATRHGGSFRLCRSACGVEARLDLPLAEGLG
jgi:signal transduction histidine kinase